MTQLLRSRPLTASRLLDHVLENPQLVSAVRELEGPALGKLIRSVGLEDAAELVALASTPQLETVFDEDLWRLDPGQWEERFDAKRFALWLHAFAEAGEEAVVRRLVELPLDFVILAVHRLILVIDIESLAVQMSSSRGDDLDLLEKALESCLNEEWEEFRLIARDDSAWDELTAALLALDRDHHELLRQILERCAALSTEWIEENGGLYEVLSSDEMLENDQRAERNDRRAEQGYISPADARAFLELARRGETDPDQRDAITNAYFRALTRSSKHKPMQQPRARSKGANGLLRLLEQSAFELAAADPSREKARRPRRSTAVEKTTTRLLDAALARLRSADPESYAARMDEIGYLANVLTAAPARRGTRLRPIEAVESALVTANRGLERLLENHSESAALELLRKTTVDTLFRRGYR